MLAEPWLLAQDTRQPPAAEIERTAGGVRRCRRRPRRSSCFRPRRPLIYGLSRSSTDGPAGGGARWRTALGATIDTTASLGHAPSVMALQQVGESTCTLGEVKNRADLVDLLGQSTRSTATRGTWSATRSTRAGLFVPRGRADRTLVVVDVQRRPTTAKLADLFVRVEPGQDFEALWALRRWSAGWPLASGRPRRAAAQLADLRRADEVAAAAAWSSSGSGLARGRRAPQRRGAAAAGDAT